MNKLFLLSLLLLLPLLSAEVNLNSESILWNGSDGYLNANFTAGRDYVEILTPELTLGLLQNISFEQYVYTGYPLSVNILLDINSDGVFESKKDLITGYLTNGSDDVLKIEWAYNGERPAFPYMNSSYYGRWFNVFDEIDVIDNSTNAWLYSVKPGDVQIVMYNLSEWKDGQLRGDQCYYVDNAWHNETCSNITIDSNTKVYGIQIESLGWIAASNATVKNITIVNGSVFVPEPVPTPAPAPSGGGSSYGESTKEYIISEKGLESGYQKRLFKKYTFSFTTNETHTLGIEKIVDDIVTIKIQSDPIYIDLISGESKNVSIDGNPCVYDLLVEAKSVSNKYADIKITRINETVENCIEKVVELVVEEPVVVEEPEEVEEVVEEIIEEPVKEKYSLWWIALIVLALIILLVMVYFSSKKESK